MPGYQRLCHEVPGGSSDHQRHLGGEPGECKRDLDGVHTNQPLSVCLAGSIHRGLPEWQPVSATLFEHWILSSTEQLGHVPF